jgi:predicted RNA methylase
MSRRLFVDDAARGFAFIDLCRRRYDVVLMNPPFGDASSTSKDYTFRTYPRSKSDLLASFVERGLEWLQVRGFLGAITSRTAFFLASFSRWREEVVLANALQTVVADLGYGVMDAAMVAAAAYCLEKKQARA